MFFFRLFGLPRLVFLVLVIVKNGHGFGVGLKKVFLDQWMVVFRHDHFVRLIDH